MFFDQIYHANYEQCHPTKMWNCFLVHYGPTIFTNKLPKILLASMMTPKYRFIASCSNGSNLGAIKLVYNNGSFIRNLCPCNPFVRLANGDR
jgi:hypothetical protein